jgi:hypothetical protein
MIETLRHLLGFCGEHWHPNLWTALAGGISFSSIGYYLRYKLYTRFKKTK